MPDPPYKVPHPEPTRPPSYDIIPPPPSPSQPDALPQKSEEKATSGDDDGFDFGGGRWKQFWKTLMSIFQTEKKKKKEEEIEALAAEEEEEEEKEEGEDEEEEEEEKYETQYEYVTMEGNDASYRYMI